MMRKHILGAIMSAAIFIPGMAAAAVDDGWELEIRATLDGGAENRIVVGQRPDAADGVDGRYDVPALLGGDLEACVLLEGEPFWRDIRSTASASPAWELQLKPVDPAGRLGLRWAFRGGDFPGTIRLLDVATGETVDMKARDSVSCDGCGLRTFRIEAGGPAAQR